MSQDIGPRIGIEGYAAYRKNMNNIIQQSKTLAAEMKAVTSAYDKNDESQEKLTKQAEILAKQIQNQQKRINALGGAVEDTAKKYGEGSTQALRYQEELNKALTAMNRMEQDLKTVQTQLDRTESGMDDVADSAEEMGDAAEAGGDGFTILKGTIADLASSAIQSVIGMVSDFTGELLGLSEATREYREMQAKLQGSTEAFGYSLDFTRGQYEEFYRYLADDQMATNAITNLLGLHTTTENLEKLTEGAIGVWTAYGDSIPIESLTESINETAQTAKVTGVLADALNWAGISEDDFNEKLQSLSSTQERADAIADTLNGTYGDSKDAYDKMTGSIQDANDAELDLKETQADLGETLEPVNTALKRLKTRALKGIEPLVEAVADGFELLEVNMSNAREEFYDTIEAVDDAKDALKDSGESLEDTTENLKKSMEEMENGESSAKVLVDALEDLEDKSGKTADEQYRMEAVVARLNGMFPDLGLVIDESTGKLNKSTESIMEYVSQSENMEIAAEKQRNAADAVAALEAAEATRAETMEKASGVTARILQLESDMNGVLDLQAEKEAARLEATQAYNDALAAGVEDTEKWHNAMMDTSEVMVEYNGQMMTASEACQLMNEDLIVLKDTEAGYREQLEAQDAAVKTAKDTLDQYNASISGSAGAMGEANAAGEGYRENLILNQETAKIVKDSFIDMMKQQTEWTKNLAGNLGNMVTEFVEMKNDLGELISSQMNLFSEFDSSVDLSTGQLISNMQSQVAGVQQWEEDILALTNSTIDDGLLKHLMDMGPEGAGYVSLFRQMSADELEQANTAWREAMDIQSFANDAGQELLEWGMEYIGGGIDDLSKYLFGGMSETGEQVPEGLAEGIESNQAAATAAAEQLGDETIDSVNGSLGVSSPSRLTKQSGKYVDDGLKSGIDSGKAQVVQSAKRLADDVIKAINTAMGTSGGMSTKTKPMGEKAGKSIATGITSQVTTVKTAAQKIANEAVRSMNSALGTSGSSSTKTKPIGQKASKGVATGITSQNSSVQSAAKRVANAAVSSMRSGLPSSTFRGMGSNAAYAMANGISSGRSAVISAAASVAASAISAARSQLQIHSPSRVFWDMGENSADAYAGGLEERKKNLIDSVMGTLDFNMQNAIAATRADADPIIRAIEGTAGTNMGGVTMNIYAAEGQSAREIADTVIYRLKHLVNQREAVFG